MMLVWDLSGFRHRYWHRLFSFFIFHNDKRCSGLFYTSFLLNECVIMLAGGTMENDMAQARSCGTFEQR